MHRTPNLAEAVSKKDGQKMTKIEFLEQFYMNVPFDDKANELLVKSGKADTIRTSGTKAPVSSQLRIHQQNRTVWPYNPVRELTEATEQ